MLSHSNQKLIMNRLKKIAFSAALMGASSVAFGGFIQLTTTNFMTETGNGSDSDMYWADLGFHVVPQNFKVDIAVSGDFTYDVKPQTLENGKTFGELAGREYQILMFLADPTAPYTPGTFYNESFDVTSLGGRKIAGVSYWDGRYGSYDPLQAVMDLVGGSYVYDPVNPGRGFESHTLDGYSQDAFSISGNQTVIDFDLWAFDTLGNGANDAFVDLAFVFVTPVPEPSSILFALTGGILGLLFYRNVGARRRRS